MKKIFLLCIIGLVMAGCSHTSSLDLSSLQCVSKDNAQCEKICADAGGKLAGTMTLSGPTNFYCTFPSSDAGAQCTQSDQCTVFCALTETQLDALNIPHSDGKNTFKMNGNSIYKQTNDETQYMNARKTMLLPKTMDQNGSCQDYAIESFTGAYEVNNGEATLVQGSQAMN